tara:strand:- start:70 stop:564 length:495 start_codon:yes stop_codon:yes gene_type:complete
MKKINNLILGFFLIIYTVGCAGYEPIFKSKTLPLIISDYTIEGDKLLANKIYSPLNSLLKTNVGNEDLKKIDLIINVIKNKNISSKDAAGKILEYKININAKIEITNTMNNNEILNQNFLASVTYKAQDQYSDTLKLEKKTTDDLINKIYQDLLIKLSEKTLSQ